jgi:hypothetical protein
MKYLNKISLLFLFMIGVFTACDADQEGAIYTTGGGLTFSSSALNSAVVSPKNPTFTVDLFRSSAEASLNGSITLSAVLDDEDKTPLSGCTVSDYSFAVGETATTVTVNVDPLEIGDELNVTLTIADGDIAVSGTKTTTVTVSKDYNWQSIGKGTFTDNFAIGKTYNVDVLKAEGFDRYRVMEPYAESMINDDGNNGNWVASSSAPYVDFWTIADGPEVRFNSFFIGLNYDGSSSQPIYAYHPSSFSLSGAFNKWVDDKTVQLAPYYYIPALGGGFDYTAKDNIIIITLP